MPSSTHRRHYVSWVARYDSRYGLTDFQRGVPPARPAACAGRDVVVRRWRRRRSVVMRYSATGTLTAVRRLGLFDTRDAELNDIAAAADGDVAV